VLTTLQGQASNVLHDVPKGATCETLKANED
jgi:hypothetical protein